jgi:hypothetical protein
VAAVRLYSDIFFRVKYGRQLADPISAHYTPGSDDFLKSGTARHELRLANLTFIARGLVKLGATLKWNGYLEESALVCRYLLKDRQTRLHGLLGLGDVYLTQANWSHELRFYRETGTWFDQEIFHQAGSLVPRSSVMSYRKAARCFLLTCRKLGAVGPEMTSLDRAVTEGGLDRSGPFERVACRTANEEPANRVASFRSSVLSVLRILSQHPSERELAPALTKFRQIAGRRKPRFRKVDQALWKLGKRRFDSNHLIVAEVATLEQICSRLGTEFQETHLSENLHYSYRCVFKGVAVERKVSRTLSSGGVARLPNVTDLGFGFYLVDDRYIAKDSKHLPWEQARIFCPWLWAFEEHSAVIELEQDRVTIAPGPLPHFPIVGHDNYYHWLVETAGTCATLDAAREPDAACCVSQSDLKSFQREILQTVISGRRVEAILPTYPRQSRISDALVAKHLARDQFAHPKATAFLRRKFNVDDEIRGQPIKLYLTRATSARASLANEQAVWSLLESYGFKQVDTGTLTVTEQKELFASCEMVAAPGGAALSNLVFCSSTAKMLILGPEMGAFETFTSLAATVGCKSWFCIGRTVEVIPHAMFIWTQHRFEIDPADLRTCLEEMHSG